MKCSHTLIARRTEIAWHDPLHASRFRSLEDGLLLEDGLRVHGADQNIDPVQVSLELVDTISQITLADLYTFSVELLHCWF